MILNQAPCLGETLQNLQSSENMKRNLKEVQDRQKQYFDAQRHPPPSLHVGDIVQKAYRSRPDEYSKLCPMWAGRYRVQNLLPNGVLDNANKIQT